MQLTRAGGNAGLACTEWAWVLSVILVIVWLLAPRLALRDRGGWRGLPHSLFGLFWFGFGVDFVLRFFLLAWESVAFGNDTYRLADVPPGSVEQAMVLSIGFWLAALAGFSLWPRLGSGAVLAQVVHAGGRAGADRRLQLLALYTACMVVTSGVAPLPLALVTPLSIVGRLWLIPATLVWADHWAGRPVGRLRWLVLAPAVLHFALSPFRENLLPLAIVPLLSLVCVRGTVPRRAVAGGVVGVLLFLAAGSFTHAYRDVRWGGHSVSAVVDRTLPSEGSEMPDPEWLLTLRRFHGFDSLLLTVDLVPSVFEFTGSALLADAFVRGIVPRALMPGKQVSDRGQEFARTIWSYDSDLASDAAIAPSMPGDLYHAAGLPLVLAGALVWGLLIGLVDRWKDVLPAGPRAAVLALLATQILPSVERDFGHSVATLIQTLLVLGLVGLVVRQLWPADSARAHASDTPHWVAEARS